MRRFDDGVTSNHPLQTAGTADAPLFCAFDVARALGYSNPSKAIIDHCKGVTILETPTKGGIQQMKFISEPEVYRLIFKSNAPKAGNVKSRLDEDDVRLVDTPTNGGIQQASFVTESGLYETIIRSDSETAKPFRKWVTGEVLPTIRKHGAYMSERAQGGLFSPGASALALDST